MQEILMEEMQSPICRRYCYSNTFLNREQVNFGRFNFPSFFFSFFLN